MWRDGDDAIYEAPRLSPTLAHVVEARDLVPRVPENGIDMAPPLPYVAAIEDPAKPRLEERWDSASEAVLKESLRPSDRISGQFFNKFNAAGDSLPYGGETKVLTAAAHVNSGQVNTITLAVADALDHVLDTAVFIQAGSLSTTPPPTQPPVTVVVPTLSEWGLILLAILLMAVAARLFRSASARR